MKTIILLIAFLFSINFNGIASNTTNFFVSEYPAISLFSHCHESMVGVDSQDFESFLMQFDLFEKEQLDKSFLKVRKKQKTERYSPQLNKSKYSSFIPYDEKCNCDREELYYRPCCRLETENFYLVNILACCDTPTKGYPFDSDIFVTYDKEGKIIDYEILGSSGDRLYCKIDFTTNNSEMVCTQYSFYNTNSDEGLDVYSGKCDVSVYKVVINDDGTIDKQNIRNYTNNVTIHIDSYL